MPGAEQQIKIVIDNLQEDEIPMAAEIFYDAFKGDELTRILHPEHKVKQAGYTREQRIGNSAKMLRKGFGKPGFVHLKATDPETKEILGMSVWVKPGYTKASLDEFKEERAKQKQKETDQKAALGRDITTEVSSSSKDGAEQKEDDDKDLELDTAALDRWVSSVGETRETVMKDEPFWYSYLLFFIHASESLNGDTLCFGWYTMAESVFHFTMPICRSLNLITVKPKAQGRGIGSAILKWAIDQVDAANPPETIVLEATPEGRKLYERRGFKVEGWPSVAPSTIDGEGVIEEKRLRAPFMVRRPPENPKATDASS